MSIARRALFGKLNLTLFRAIESATAFAKLRGNPYIELVHWLHQLWQLPNGDLQRICEHHKFNKDTIERELLAALDALPAGASSISDFSRYVEQAIERAWLLASLRYQDHSVRGAWLISAMLDTPELRKVLCELLPMFRAFTPERFDEGLAQAISSSSEEGERAYDSNGMEPATPGSSSRALAEGEEGSKSALGKFCSDLTERARAGEIDPVIGREHEIHTMTDILLRRRQNNPLLTGEAGVGKTAVVEGLALAIAGGNVPPALKEVRLLSLDVGALLAGASMRGEFESRLKSVLKEASDSPKPVILFVDEVHTLVGAGGQAGTGDAANLLKPALARGNLRTIGATTWGEYKKHIEKDPALTRRFQVLQILEPQEAQAVAMVRGLVASFEKHHGVNVLDEAVVSAVTLSHRYIPARQLPDKAISLLDTACARVAMSLHSQPAQVNHWTQQVAAIQTEQDLVKKEAHFGKDCDQRLSAIADKLQAANVELKNAQVAWQREQVVADQIVQARQSLGPSPSGADEEEPAQPVADADKVRTQLAELGKELHSLQGEAPLVHIEVDAQVVANIVSNWTGIPVGRMVRDDVAAVLNLREQLSHRVIGQDPALEVLMRRVQAARVRLTDPGKPVGTFLLVGPSGVGKTETALALAEALYGGEQNLITINMSEYQEAHTVSTLKGAPPGYVGYGEGGVLTEAVRRRPYSVVLLDEIEKAHPDVHEVFFQVFDKGWMEDGEGRVIDFKNTLILLTSNCGSDKISQLCNDETLLPSYDALRDAINPELRKAFPAAFLGRLTVVPYLPLGPSTFGAIIRVQLNKVVRRIQEQHHIALSYSQNVIDVIAKKCTSHETGARLLASYIDQNILPTLAQLWLTAMQEHQHISRIDMDGVSDDKSYTDASPNSSSIAASIRAGDLTYRTQS